MKNALLAALAGAGALVLASLTGCQKDKPAPNVGTFVLHLDHVVGADPLLLDVRSYKNALGQDFSVSVFKYYLSNLVLNKADGSHQVLPDTYFLVDAARPTTRDLRLGNVPGGDYTSLTLTLGVDSTRTRAGNYTGDLSPSNNMFWDMNGPEFKNLVFEGHSPQAPHPAPATTGGLVYHIAGFRHASTNTIRTFSVPFPAATPLLVRPDKTPNIHTLVDVAQLFRSPNRISFADSASYNVMGGRVAARIADNAAHGLFAVALIQAE